MPRSAHAASAGTETLARRTRRTARVLLASVVVLAFSASAALAAHLGLTLGSSTSSTLGERVMVNGQGRTLYALSPETSRHLLCKTSECLQFWPPVTVGSATTKLKNGPGVQGHLGILRRSNRMFQVTLRGMPLYRYSQDRAKGDVKGEGLESFGGTWHAATASSGETVTKPSTPSMTPTTPTTPSPPVTPMPAPPPYQYPVY